LLVLDILHEFLGDFQIWSVKTTLSGEQQPFTKSHTSKKREAQETITPFPK